MNNREKLTAKIAALRAKTTASGCTEAEAIAAAERAAELMREHGLTDADIEMSAASAKETTRRPTWRSTVAGIVSYVTNSSSVLHPEEKRIEFIGRDPGPEIAAYLYAVLVNAVERGVREFKEGQVYKRRRTTATRKVAVGDFISGMVVRLDVRLRELFHPTISKEARAEAKSALALRYPRLVNWSPPKKKTRFNEALNAGWRAGEKVTLAHGVAGPDGRPLAVGGGS